MSLGETFNRKIVAIVRKNETEIFDPPSRLPGMEEPFMVSTSVEKGFRIVCSNGGGIVDYDKFSGRMSSPSADVHPSLSVLSE